jgi:hypothetical protein
MIKRKREKEHPTTQKQDEEEKNKEREQRRQGDSNEGEVARSAEEESVRKLVPRSKASSRGLLNTSRRDARKKANESQL